MKLVKKYFPIIYILLLIIGYFYARDIVNGTDLEIDEVDIKKEAVEVKPVDVSLVVETTSHKREYSARMDNVNTFDDFLEHLRDSEEFFFEKTEYIYGTEYDQVNYFSTPQDYVWRVYENNQDITYKTRGHQLKDKAVYKLVFEKK